MTRLLVQLSDPHIKAPGSLAYGRVDTALFLTRAVKSVLALPQHAEAVLITGDLTDHGRADEYAHLRRLLQPLRCPVYLLPGNHDERAALRAAFPDHAYLQTATRSDGFVQYAADLSGLRLVVADSVHAGAPHGQLCTERLQQLDALLSQAPSSPTVLAMHHPPFMTGIGHMDENGLREPSALEALVRRHPQIERIVCGHLHRSIQTRWAGTLAMTAPSTAHQVCLDLSAKAASAFVMEPPGFVVHAWGPNLPLVSHVAASGQFDGPYPFHADGALID